MFCFSEKVIIVAGAQKRELYRELHKAFNLLFVASEYLVALITFITESVESLEKKSVADLTIYQKGSRYA